MHKYRKKNHNMPPTQHKSVQYFYSFHFMNICHPSNSVATNSATLATYSLLSSLMLLSTAKAFMGKQHSPLRCRFQAERELVSFLPSMFRHHNLSTLIIFLHVTSIFYKQNFNASTKQQTFFIYYAEKNFTSDFLN